jgi:hypothetical protein
MADGTICCVDMVREGPGLGGLPVSQFTEFDPSKKYELEDNGDIGWKPEDSHVSYDADNGHEIDFSRFDSPDPINPFQSNWTGPADNQKFQFEEISVEPDVVSVKSKIRCLRDDASPRVRRMTVKHSLPHQNIKLPLKTPNSTQSSANTYSYSTTTQFCTQQAPTNSKIGPQNTNNGQDTVNPPDSNCSKDTYTDSFRFGSQKPTQLSGFSLHRTVSKKFTDMTNFSTYDSQEQTQTGPVDGQIAPIHIETCKNQKV